MSKEKIKSMADQMEDRTGVLEKATGLKLWCWGTCGHPFLYEIGFDLVVRTHLNFTERDPQQDIVQIKAGLYRGIAELNDKLKRVEEYEHNKQSG